MSRTRLNVITLGIMLSLFLASVEGTIVATAMPTTVAQLGGFSIYSWVFAIYMLASTTTVPIYGKLSDLYGRKVVYVVSMGLFLAGSVMCGLAQSMEQLILFRAVQGLGAGGVLPLAFTIVGELFSLEQRARMQGLFSGVWGVSSVIGPLIGGFLVDQISWRWVFFINIPPGLLAITLVWLSWKGSAQAGKARAAVDYHGALLLTAGVLALLLGLEMLETPPGWALLAAAAGLFIWFYRVERRAADPILPFSLFRDRLFAVSIAHGVLVGWAMFGSVTFVPLFVQAVLGRSATEAGIALTPMSLAWTTASIIGSPLLLKVGYRTLALAGMALVTLGAFLMASIGAGTGLVLVMAYLCLMGTGMGLCIPAFLIAVQSTVRREDLGIATSTIQFSRSIGGTLGVSILGILLSARFSSSLLKSGVDPSSVALDSLLDRFSGAAASLGGPVREALAGAVAGLFWAAFLVALAGLLVVLLAPRGMIAQLARERAAERSAG